MVAPSNGGRAADSALAVLKIAGVVVSCATGLVATYYTTRDALEQEIRSSLESSRTQMRAEMNQTLAHYVTLEQFLEWRRDWEAKRTAQYYTLLQAIDAVDRKVTRR